MKRLLCNARVWTVFEDRAGRVLGLGRVSREPSAWMIRQIRYRDRDRGFPGCGARRYIEPTTSCGGVMAAAPTSTICS